MEPRLNELLAHLWIITGTSAAIGASERDTGIIVHLTAVSTLFQTRVGRCVNKLLGCGLSTTEGMNPSDDHSGFMQGCTDRILISNPRFK
jgi:hypothetical protein